MTEQESKVLLIFENRVRQLITLYSDLKAKMEISQMLYKELEQENKMLKNKYDNLKMARIISAKQNDFDDTKNKLSRLVKKVDKCIALLNE